LATADTTSCRARLATGKELGPEDLQVGSDIVIYGRCFKVTCLSVCLTVCRVRLATGKELGPEDLQVGSDITIYGRCFTVTGCDAATRSFYEEQLHMPQGPNQPQPEGQYEQRVKVGAREAWQSPDAMQHGCWM
jgi:riboflavin synthase alpha subunit